MMFDPKESIKRAKTARIASAKWRLESEGHEYVWASKLERVGIIREGIPYAAIEVISRRINVPVKEVLPIFGMPQTTYNKKRREKSLLNGRDSEIILLLTELVDFGIEVFNNEEEATLEFTKEGEFVADYGSFISRQPSIQNIQALEDCEFLVIDYEDLQNLYKKSKNANFLGRMIIEHRFVIMVNQLLTVHQYNPENRYRYFLQHYKDLVQRIPQYHIASYVGVKPQSLSRIRKRII